MSRVSFLTVTIPLLMAGALGLAGCGTAGLRVESDPPGADVYIVSDGQAPRKVGQTPYLSTETLGSQPAQLTISKEGFRSETILVPSFRMAASGRAYAKLEPGSAGAAGGAACALSDESIQELSGGVAEAQALIGARNLDEAERKLNALITRHSNVGVVYNLLGNVHYLRKDVVKALAAYKRALEISPNSSETARMIKKLNDIRSAGGAR